MIETSLVSTDLVASPFGVKGNDELFVGSMALNYNMRIDEASLDFFSAGVARVRITALSTGAYAGDKGNYISCVFYRLSANRFAVQMFTRDGSQINGNVIDTGGISGTVAKFNADTDVNSDFLAEALTANVDVAFSAGTGYANSTQLMGGSG